MRRVQCGTSDRCDTGHARLNSACRLHFYSRVAMGRVVELADTTDLKSVARKGLRVQVPPRPPHGSVQPVLHSFLSLRGLVRPGG